MENAKYTDADRKKVELEIKKQWERWHKRNKNDSNSVLN
jgi:hypothetical protein